MKIMMVMKMMMIIIIIIITIIIFIIITITTTIIILFLKHGFSSSLRCLTSLISALIFFCSFFPSPPFIFSSNHLYALRKTLSCSFTPSLRRGTASLAKPPRWPNRLAGLVVKGAISQVAGLVGCLLNVPATCQCISGTDLHRQFYVLPH